MASINLKIQDSDSSKQFKLSFFRFSLNFTFVVYKYFAMYCSTAYKTDFINLRSRINARKSRSIVRQIRKYKVKCGPKCILMSAFMICRKKLALDINSFIEVGHRHKFSWVYASRAQYGIEWGMLDVGQGLIFVGTIPVRKFGRT